MAQFDESKIINALHVDKAEVEKKYFFSDELLDLKCSVTSVRGFPQILTTVSNRFENACHPFIFGDSSYQFIYPYEEEP